MPHEENKVADDVCRAAYTAGGAFIMLDNTGSISKGAANVVARPTAHINIPASNNSNTDNDGGAESETLKED